jgi:hypothetical protein
MTFTQAATLSEAQGLSCIRPTRMWNYRWDWLEATTGPVMLYHAVQAYKAVYPKLPGVNILKPGLIYPIDWRRTVWGPNDGPGDLLQRFLLWKFCACIPAWITHF